MKYEAIIFDLDGVICHTDQYHYQAWKKLADKLGIYFDEELNNLLRGVSREDSLKIILQQRKTPEDEKRVIALSQEEKQKLMEEKNNFYKELLNQMSEKDLSYEVKESLHTLHKAGFRLAIGSSSKNTKFILERLGLGTFFDAISDGNNITQSKPDPEVFVKAAKYVNTDQCTCLVVEDAVAGIQAAAAAKMDSAAIGDARLCNQATYNLNRFSDLLNIV